MSSANAVLVLENGRVFSGRSVGAPGEQIGEVVFHTSMSGYQEVLSDPSYKGQIVVMTSPQIGNTGVNAEDMESAVLSVSGMVMREMSPVASNWRSTAPLGEFLVERDTPAIDGIDTRALTRVLRDEGAMRGAISDQVADIEGILSRIRQSRPMAGQDLVSTVTCSERYEWHEGGWIPPEDRGAHQLAAAEFSVVAFDFGIKTNILRELRNVGCKVTVVPAGTSAKEVLALSPDGIFLSNGPGDPGAVQYAIETVRSLATSGIPMFGICLGHQILALAMGAATFKLRFGHHGANHPVMELATKKVEITSQNHGFAVDAESLPKTLRETHRNLFDQTVAGLEVLGQPIFSVQYHPEASPGPHDSSPLFGRFAGLMRHGSQIAL